MSLKIVELKTNHCFLSEDTIAKTTLPVLLCPNIVLKLAVQTTTLCMKRSYLSSGQNSQKQSKQWGKWVQAVKRLNSDGSKWEPHGNCV